MKSEKFVELTFRIYLQYYQKNKLKPNYSVLVKLINLHFYIETL